MNVLTIDDLQLKGRRVLMRVDFNVPLKEGAVAEDFRIRASMPSIRKVIEEGGKLILMSHLGRPKGKPNPEMSLRPVATVLESLLGKKVAFATDCVGEVAEEAVSRLRDGDVLLLENLRFHAEEKANNSAFSQRLARLGDVFVNDAFGTAHRAHSSTEGVTHYFRQIAAGYLMKRELDYLEKAFARPSHPFIAIIGGAKISGKLDILSNLLDKVDKILIGGAMSFTYLKSQGCEVGSSLVEDEMVEAARELKAKADDAGVPIVCPIDFACATNESESSKVSYHCASEIPPDLMGLDIGPETEKLFDKELDGSKTVVWNGPMGRYEKKRFSSGTYAIAQILSVLTEHGCTTIVGGGDSLAALAKSGLENKLSHISTGGGALLEYLEGRTLPGVAALTRLPLVSAN